MCKRARYYGRVLRDDVRKNENKHAAGRFNDDPQTRRKSRTGRTGLLRPWNLGVVKPRAYTRTGGSNNHGCDPRVEVGSLARTRQLTIPTETITIISVRFERRSPRVRIVRWSCHRPSSGPKWRTDNVKK